MNTKKLGASLAILALSLSIGLSHSSAEAKDHGNKHHDKQGKHWDKNDVRRNSYNQNNYRFNPSYRTSLIDSLNGRGNYRLSQAEYDRMRSQRNLPPGIRKQLARGKGLPPGFQNNAYILPQSWNSRYNVPSNARIGVYDNDAVIYDNNSNTILDILSNVF